MYILGKKWRDGYLDYHCEEGQIRVQVRVWMNICPVSGIYVERSKSIRLVWGFIREIGIRSVIQKIRSRLKESLRNKRFVSVGLGRVAEGSICSEYPVGTPVLFIAPCHPRCVERIVVPRKLVRGIDESLMWEWERHCGIAYVEARDAVICDEELRGWHFMSGLPISEENVDFLVRESIRFLGFCKRKNTRIHALHIPTAISERSSAPQPFPSERCLQAVLFGLGNYAKSIILASKPPGVKFECVHEIDPTQIGNSTRAPWIVDTSPLPRRDEKYDIYFIAGYHHTHSDLAIAALEAGAYAVVEKPLVTTEEQLERLLAVLRKYPDKLFTCFHMRYNPLFALAKRDLAVKIGEPIHYYCTVFEERLPERHWYTWPNSGSHLISNGCHWVDHFLWMNGYATPNRCHVWKCGNGDTQVSAELENGAVFGMHLTHSGSQRIGVQDHVELRANGRTVTVDHGSKYLAQGPSSIIRKKTGNRLTAYRTMYKEICKKIVAGEPGDSYESVIRTNRLVLTMEEMWQGSPGGPTPLATDR